MELLHVAGDGIDWEDAEENVVSASIDLLVVEPGIGFIDEPNASENEATLLPFLYKPD